MTMESAEEWKSSLIVSSSPNNLESTLNLQYRGKLEDLGFKQVPFSRHASEEEFKKFHNFRQQAKLAMLETGAKVEGIQMLKPPFQLGQKAKSPGKFKGAGRPLGKESFKVIRRLGEGKFGSVYLAKEILTGMVVALKVVNKSQILRDNFLVNKKEELRSTFCGTPLYLSPEIVQGSKYDEKVDLWAVGVLAFEIYYGCSPFNISEQADLYKIVPIH
ncbi:unnamed protein product [Sphagnum balticum]